MRIEIISTDVKTFPGKEGKQERRVQTAMVHYENGETRKWELGLNRDQPAHAPGFYALGPSDFYPDKYGPKVTGWPKLVRLDAAKTKAP